MCVLSIKVPIRKKSRNLFNDPRIYACYIYVYIYIYIYIYIVIHRQTVSFYQNSSVWLDPQCLLNI